MCTVPVAPSQDTEGLCGRPLGLAFHRKSGDLYIADAYKVLMRVGPDGGEVEVLATSAGGVPFNFVNDIDIDQATCDVYFTDNSVTFNTEIMMNADGEAAKVRRGDEAGDIAQGRLAVPQRRRDLPGYPDNVRRDEKGGYWVVLNQYKGRPGATAAPLKHLVGVRLDGGCVEVEELTAAKGVTLNEVPERKGQLWLGSVELDYIVA
uniref:Strictosidine synthase conserved region domain-containing protein n=1 Tax=Hordeum vulgare subsp. vulgare TaxID=112509 RepID=A0A8I6XN91_HORVV